jgi:hypothetical protein
MAPQCSHLSNGIHQQLLTSHGVGAFWPSFTETLKRRPHNVLILPIGSSSNFWHCFLQAATNMQAFSHHFPFVWGLPWQHIIVITDTCSNIVYPEPKDNTYKKTEPSHSICHCCSPVKAGGSFWREASSTRVLVLGLIVHQLRVTPPGLSMWPYKWKFHEKKSKCIPIWLSKMVLAQHFCIVCWGW